MHVVVFRRFPILSTLNAEFLRNASPREVYFSQLRLAGAPGDPMPKPVPTFRPESYTFSLEVCRRVGVMGAETARGLPRQWGPWETLCVCAGKGMVHEPVLHRDSVPGLGHSIPMTFLEFDIPPNVFETCHTPNPLGHQTLARIMVTRGTKRAMLYQGNARTDSMYYDGAPLPRPKMRWNEQSVYAHYAGEDEGDDDVGRSIPALFPLWVQAPAIEYFDEWQARLLEYNPNAVIAPWDPFPTIHRADLPNHPTNLKAVFKWMFIPDDNDTTPPDNEMMTLEDACLALEHWVSWI